MKNTEKITIECSGCKRTQTLRKIKVSKCDFYLCSLGECKLNPDFEIPKRDGYIISFEINAAGAFTGVKYEVPTQEHIEGVKRAKQILYTGMMQLKEEGQNSKYN